MVQSPLVRSGTLIVRHLGVEGQRVQRVQEYALEVLPNDGMAEARQGRRSGDSLAVRVCEEYRNLN